MSRTTLLLQKELWKIENSIVPWGINIDLVRNSIYHWKCQILGPEGTPWQGGIFYLELLFSQDYNEIPPDVFFTSVPFHPNIDMYTGRPCVDFLLDNANWVPGLSIVSLLLQLQSLLTNPVLENPVNPSAADMIESNPSLYERLIRDSVIASRRLAEGLPLTEDEPELSPDDPRRAATPIVTSFTGGRKINVKIVPKPQEAPKKRTFTYKMSYEKYYQSWKQLATSVPTDKPEIATQSIKSPYKLFAFGREKLSGPEIASIAQKQAHLWFGRFKFTQDTYFKRPHTAKDALRTSIGSSLAKHSGPNSAALSKPQWPISQDSVQAIASLDLVRDDDSQSETAPNAIPSTWPRKLKQPPAAQTQQKNAGEKTGPVVKRSSAQTRAKKVPAWAAKPGPDSTSSATGGISLALPRLPSATLLNDAGGDVPLSGIETDPVPLDVFRAEVPEAVFQSGELPSVVLDSGDHMTQLPQTVIQTADDITQLPDGAAQADAYIFFDGSVGQKASPVRRVSMDQHAVPGRPSSVRLSVVSRKSSASGRGGDVSRRGSARISTGNEAPQDPLMYLPGGEQAVVEEEEDEDLVGWAGNLDATTI